MMELPSKNIQYICFVVFIINLNIGGTFGSEWKFQDLEDDSKMCTVVIEIIKKHYPVYGRTTTVVYGDPPESLIPSLMMLNMKVVMMGDLIPKGEFVLESHEDVTENYFLHRVGFVLFFTNSPEMIGKGLVELSQSIYWINNVKIIIYCKDNIQEHKLFYLFWWYRVLNSVILRYNENKQEVIIIEYTPFVVIRGSEYNQYQCSSLKAPDEMYEGDMFPEILCEPSCSEYGMINTNDSLSLVTCVETKSNFFTPNLTIYEDKTENLKGYTLGVFGVHVPPMGILDMTQEGLNIFQGKDGKVLNTLAYKMNFTVSFDKGEKGSETTSSFQKFVNGLMNLAFRKLVVSANTMYLIPVSFPPLDLTYPTEGSGLCFLVQRAGEIPTWQNLVNIFDKNTLIGMSSTFALITLFYVYNLKKAKNSTSDSLALGFLYTTLFFLSMPVSIIKGNDTVRLIIFIVFWLIFVVNFMFQGLIVSYFTVPRYGKEVETFEDLVATGFYIEGYPSPDAVLPPTSDIFITLNKRFKQRYELFGCATDLVSVNDKACWLDCLTAKHLVKTLKDKKGNVAIHTGRDRIHSHFLSYPMTKNSPFRLRVEHYTNKIMESGLLNKWHMDAINVSQVETSEVKILQMADLKGCFYFLVFGHFISLGVFLLEVIFKIKYKKLFIKFYSFLISLFKCKPSCRRPTPNDNLARD